MSVCLRTEMQKATSFEVAFWLGTCLTMSYFHGRMPTIIGAKAFHGPVRDGKEWFHFAIVVRHNCVVSSCRKGITLGSPAATNPIW